MDIICHDALFLFFCIIGPVHDPAEVIHLGVTRLYEFFRSLRAAVTASAVDQYLLIRVRQFLQGLTADGLIGDHQ